jgi:hypothetical protein
MPSESGVERSRTPPLCCGPRRAISRTTRERPILAVPRPQISGEFFGEPFPLADPGESSLFEPEPAWATTRTAWESYSHSWKTSGRRDPAVDSSGVTG